ncbi:MAG: CDP-diacylglycerol--glycerol-3-phosphate 3-phosphatidyltransferase [Saprospiraceae bacterium]
MNEVKKSIPNILTITRILLAVGCTYYAFKHDKWSLKISLGLFLLASFTDFLDGYLARKWNTTTNFGKITDPIADKLLILGVLFSFSMKEVVPFLFTIIIAFREVILTFIRLVLAPKKIVIASVSSGKFKTFSQILCLISIYLILIFIKPLTEKYGIKAVHLTIYILVIWMVIVTIYSGIEFFILNKRAIKKLM